jgi:hypothetical protein
MGGTTMDIQRMNTYPVTIDYGQTLAEMVQAGKYDCCDDDITPDHFPLIGEGTVTAQLVLVDFWPEHWEFADVEFETEDALQKLQHEGLEPAPLNTCSLSAPSIGWNIGSGWSSLRAPPGWTSASNPFRRLVQFG